MNLILRFRERLEALSHPLVLELEQILLTIRTAFRGQHHDDGTHGDITATRVTVTGDIAATSATISGAVTATSVTATGAVTAASASLSGRLQAGEGIGLLGGAPDATNAVNITGTTAEKRLAHLGLTGTDAYVAVAGSGGGGLVTGAQAYAFAFRNDAGFIWGLGATEAMRLVSTGLLLPTLPIEFAEIADPSAGGSNTGRLYVRDDGAGKTQLCVRFATGAIQVLATEP